MPTGGIMENEITLTEWMWICDREFPRKDPMDVPTPHTRGGLITVIGARESNVPEYWNHPNCAFLSGDEAVKRGLPKNTRAVVFTRWVGHTAFKTILNMARKHDLWAYPIQGTGQLKRTLAGLLEPPRPPVVMAKATPAFVPPPPVVPELVSPAPEPETSVVEPEAPELAVQPEPPAPSDPQPSEEPMAKWKITSPPPPRGEVTAWVRAQYTPTLKFADLIRLAEADKVPYKESSISAAFYAIKRGVLPRQKPQKPNGAPPAATGGNGHALVVDTPDDLVRLIDDALAGLHLVREAAQKVAADRAKMTQILKLLQS
jgi:hypothetical protein